MKKYAIIKDNKVVKRGEGSYADNLDEIKKYRPCIIIQRHDQPDEDGSKSQRIHYGAAVTPIRDRLSLIIMLVALLTASCAETPADGQKSLPIQDLESGLDLTDTTTPEVLATSECFDLEAEWEAVSRLAHAFAVVESNDNPHAVNHSENAVGLLQIRPIMVRQANQIVGEDIYTLSDRHDSLTSIAIFHTVMSELNPTLDVDKAIDIWNPNASTEYRNLVKAVYEQ